MIETTMYELNAQFTNRAIDNDESLLDKLQVVGFSREQLDITRMALEKQIPRVPDRLAGHPACSRCGTVLCPGDTYCCRCGQRRAKA